MEIRSKYEWVYEPSPQQAAGYLRRTIMIHPAEAYHPPSFATANYGEIRPAIHPRCLQRSILAKADKIMRTPLIWTGFLIFLLCFPRMGRADLMVVQMLEDLENNTPL